MHRFAGIVMEDIPGLDLDSCLSDEEDCMIEEMSGKDS